MRDGNSDQQFELEEYDSDTPDASARGSNDDGGFSASTLALLEKLRGPTRAQPDSDDSEEVKIFYCSRTHSQLAQFVGELRRVVLPPSIPSDTEDDGIKNQSNEAQDEHMLQEVIKHLSLGSRKTMCINPKVQSLGNATAINERCLDLQRPGVAADKKCPFAPTSENQLAMDDFRDHVLARVHDIEDIGKIGKKRSICPYYASRPVIKHSEVSDVAPLSVLTSMDLINRFFRLLLFHTLFSSKSRHERP